MFYMISGILLTLAKEYGVGVDEYVRKEFMGLKDFKN